MAEDPNITRSSMTVAEEAAMREALAAVVDWWDTIAALGEAAGRQMTFAKDYQPSWLANVRRLAQS